MTIAFRHDPTGRDGGRGGIDRELVGLPAGRQARDIGPDVVRIDTFGEIARPQGRIEIKGDGAIRDLNATEDIDVEGESPLDLPEADELGAELAQLALMKGAADLLETSA